MSEFNTITLRNHIPIINHNSTELLSKSERRLSQFFKCCSEDSSDKKCFWSGNDVNKYKTHIQSSHQNVFCCYCLSNKEFNEEIKCFKAEEADQLIEHMIESHGRRIYQCNRCQYRAITSTHLQLHQISIHFHIWTEHNLTIKYDSLNDENFDGCKIIVCKRMNTSFPTLSPMSVVSGHSPDMDSDLKENVSYCLLCHFSNEDSMQVFMHCTRKHPDFDLCIYNRDYPKWFSFDDNSIDGQTQTLSDSDSDSDQSKKEQINGSKSLINNFKTQLSFGSKPNIPGIEEDFIPLKDSSEWLSRPKPYKNFKPKKRTKNFKRKDSFDSYFQEDFGDYQSYDGVPTSEVQQSIRPPIQPIINPMNRLETNGNFIPMPLNANQWEAPVPRQPIVQKPVNVRPIFNNLPNFTAQQNQKPNYFEKQKIKKSQKNYKLKPNERLSGITYKQHRQQQQQKRAIEASKNLTSTPISVAPPLHSQMPTEIDLQQTETELGLNSNGFRNNSFKKINRIGATGGGSGASTGASTDKTKQAFTYVQRKDDDFNEYFEILDGIPKRGIKARFENLNHFELTPLQNKQLSVKKLFKCVLCPDVQPFRENNISIHLSSVHKTQSTFKCGSCDYVGERNLIISHSKVSHPNPSNDYKIEKFIVNINQSSSIGFTSGSNLEKPKTTARKSTNCALTVKGAKGALTQRIRESTYIGPLKNEVTKRKIDNPFERVYSRSSHSSDIRPKKRTKLNSESDIEMQSDNYFPSDSEMSSNKESDDNISETEEIQKKVSVAKKSTSRPSALQTSQVSITLPEEEIPSKYFCVFCFESTFIFNNLTEAIEHYKTHLNLGYTCGVCHQFFVSYTGIEHHWNLVHKEKEKEMDFTDNMSKFINDWIIEFLNNQIKRSDFAENVVDNNTDIGMVCPLCVKAAKICNTRPRTFDALWKVKLHICKHLNWFPMKCNLNVCKESEVTFPINPYLLMKHLIDYHFTSCENLYNISFRGQKPFNDMKKEQIKLIEKHFSSVTFISSEIINSFFKQLMTELDLKYENQLKRKFSLSNEVRINVERIIYVKSEPIDETFPQINDPNVKNEDKKDIKLQIKSEFKSEIKTEFKSDVKSEVKDEIEGKTNPEVDNEKSDELIVSDSEQNPYNFLSRIYGEELPSTSQKKTSEIPEEITLSSDDES